MAAIPALFGALGLLMAAIGLYGVLPAPSRSGRAKSASAWRSGHNART
jgi:hypothetical protein